MHRTSVRQAQWFAAAVVVLLLVASACEPSVADDPNRRAGPEPSSTATVSSAAPTRLVAHVTAVIDGDTIEVELDGQRQRVHLLTIDAPDYGNGDCFSNAATAFVFAVAPPGTPLLLERDTSEADDSRRLLRYVYLPDGSMLNEQLLRGGFARMKPVEPDTKYLERLHAAEEEAQDRGAGLWAECGDEDEPTPSATAVPITATPSQTLLPVVTATPMVAPTPSAPLAGPSPTPTTMPTATATPIPTPTATGTVTATPTTTATPVPTANPTATADPRAGCDPSYPTVCIPPAPPDLDCGDIPYRRFQVIGADPHRFDRDKDGIGCES